MFIFAIVFIFVLTLLFFAFEGIDNFAYLFPALCNTIITVYVMFSRPDKPYTLQKIVNLFIYIFFILANAIQFARHTNVLTFHLKFVDCDFVLFQFVLLFILIIYNFSYNSIYHNQKQHIVRLTPHIIHKHRNNIKVYNNILLLIGIIGTLIVLVYFSFNPYKLFFRGLSESLAVKTEKSVELESSVSLIFENTIRPLAWAAFMVSLLYRSHKFVRISLFIMTLISTCPTGLARNATAMLYIPVVILLLRHWLKKNRFMWTMIIAIFFIFPFLNLFRRWNGNFSFSWSLDFLNDINFDASQTFMAAMKVKLITFGEQLMGVLLFFVPRKWWPDKPGGSGHFLVHKMNGWFDNISMPYFGEGYMNFGYVGVMVFILILAWISANMDILYWYKWKKTLDFRRGYYYILIGALVFIMRGDLLSSFAYTVGVMLSYTICVIIGSTVRFKFLKIK